MKYQRANIKNKEKSVREGKDYHREDFRRRLYDFTLRLIELIDKLPRETVSWRIGDQLLRSGTSIIGNYVEARAGSSRKDYTNYFNTCLKSANESRLWLELLRDSGRVSNSEVEWFLRELTEVSNIFASSILTLKSKK